jgi:hypothetical protein
MEQRKEIIQTIKPATFKPAQKNFYGMAEGFKIITTKQIIRLGINMYQECCEHPGYFMSEDNFDDFINAELLDIVIVNECLRPEELSDLYEGSVIFVNINTSKGVLQFTAYNSQNGYYGHNAVIESAQLTHMTRL